ncbi:YncE family protein [Lacticaseibacillus rhamnosus]|uniref:YncE family protein n=1 Tax=Lacticaseibacillus rhamnosus TaxID=47715 RepID=UPI0007E1496D|nr:hypothetical protein [Lacticaseibacillus rhamnosus]OAU15787.1 hypothetical protein PY76_06340 [Lacticaseibacillus rhamnosus]OAU20193.1 hypothetical protein PY78_13540 [Lacticaseibacillus rhamnosus]OAU22161.1 hypothetical protein PY77_01425 [Lacticaseibacillus rhamnosus]
MGKVAYVTNTDSNDISVVDLQTSSEINRIAIGDSPRGAMAIDKKGDWVLFQIVLATPFLSLT